MSSFESVKISCDLCVVGGGLSGVCAAISAARNGADVVLVQDRPMLGGNASSEIRMWVCGAVGDNLRETGIIEEIMLKNYYRNPYKNYSIWDSVILETVMENENIRLLLNCSCMNAEAQDDAIKHIVCWQTTTQKFFRIKARIFADCSGDSVLAVESNAEYRVGRESSDEFGEEFGAESADKKTMGMSCLIQAREYDEERIFIPPAWARKLTARDMRHRFPNLSNDTENFWYLELGGDRDSIGDTEEVRDELLKLAYGVWDFLKNDESCKEKHKNRDIDWIGILPGKRESRRYVGDYILTEKDILSGFEFSDAVAYGGWPLDDHNPSGFNGINERPNRVKFLNHPYTIPFRCLYSRNISNLMFAGRNISASHAALSSTRVMGTCSVIGQAVGTAAAMAVKYNITPRMIDESRIDELRSRLMYDDCFIPGTKRRVNKITSGALISTDMSEPENLRNGYDRPTEDGYNVSIGKPGCFFEYSFKEPRFVEKVRIVFDSDLNRQTLPPRERKLNRNMYHNIPLGMEASYVPKTLIKSFRVVFLREDNEQETVAVSDNYQRLVYVPCNKKIKSVKLIFDGTHGGEECRVFAVDLIGKE